VTQRNQSRLLEVPESPLPLDEVLPLLLTEPPLLRLLFVLLLTEPVFRDVLPDRFTVPLFLLVLVVLLTFPVFLLVLEPAERTVPLPLSVVVRLTVVPVFRDVVALLSLRTVDAERDVAVVLRVTLDVVARVTERVPAVPRVAVDRDASLAMVADRVAVTLVPLVVRTLLGVCPVTLR